MEGEYTVVQYIKEKVRGQSTMRYDPVIHNKCANIGHIDFDFASAIDPEWCMFLNHL